MVLGSERPEGTLSFEHQDKRSSESRIIVASQVNVVNKEYSSSHHIVEVETPILRDRYKSLVLKLVIYIH